MTLLMSIYRCETGAVCNPPKPPPAEILHDTAQMELLKFSQFFILKENSPIFHFQRMNKIEEKRRKKDKFILPLTSLPDYSQSLFHDVGCKIFQLI